MKGSHHHLVFFDILQHATGMRQAGQLWTLKLAACSYSALDCCPDEGSMLSVQLELAEL